MVKRFVEHLQFNINSTILTTGLFNIIPQYIIIIIAVFAFVIVIGLLGIAFYYIKRKFDSIDNYTDKSTKNNDGKPPNTYKKTKKEYTKQVSDLDAKILPDGQAAANFVDRVIEFKKKK